jgi:hypothetical protein
VRYSNNDNNNNEQVYSELLTSAGKSAGKLKIMYNLELPDN